MGLALEESDQRVPATGCLQEQQWPLTRRWAYLEQGRAWGAQIYCLSLKSAHSDVQQGSRAEAGLLQLHSNWTNTEKINVLPSPYKREKKRKGNKIRKSDSAPAGCPHLLGALDSCTRQGRFLACLGSQEKRVRSLAPGCGSGCHRASMRLSRLLLEQARTRSVPRSRLMLRAFKLSH